MKKVDCALLSPCWRTFEVNILRAQFDETIWNHAKDAVSSDEMSPTDYGWQKNEDDILQPRPIRFEGSFFPNTSF